jgi:hypothetical protein
MQNNNKKDSDGQGNKLKPSGERPNNISLNKSKNVLVDTFDNSKTDKVNSVNVIEIKTGKEESKTSETLNVSTPQLITWGMLFIGWCITVFLYRKNKNNASIQRKSDRHDQYVKEFRDLIFNVESNAIAYWTENTKDDDQVTLLNFQRELKELTSKAKEIDRVGGIKYETKPFIKLRRYVTLDNDVKPLQVGSNRILELRGTVSELTRSYIRKSDC